MRYVYILIPKDTDKSIITYESSRLFNSYFFDTDGFYLYRFDRKIKYMKRIINHDNKY